MNADALPLGHAPFLLITENEDGTFDRSPCMTREIAESLARFLKGICPEKSYAVQEETPVFPALKGRI